MKLEDFKNDDRFATLCAADIACHGGDGPRLKRVCTTAAWMLAPENSTGLIAVLDPYDMTVATRGYGHVAWTSLADFEA